METIKQVQEQQDCKEDCVGYPVANLTNKVEVQVLTGQAYSHFDGGGRTDQVHLTVRHVTIILWVNTEYGLVKSTINNKKITEKMVNTRLSKWCNEGRLLKERTTWQDVYSEYIELQNYNYEQDPMGTLSDYE